MVDRARYCFKLTAWNELAGVDDAFLLIYYVRNDGSNDIEIQDPKHKKRFLTRIAYPQLKVEDVRPGGRIMIYSRQYKVRRACLPPRAARRRRRRQRCAAAHGTQSRRHPPTTPLRRAPRRSRTTRTRRRARR